MLREEGEETYVAVHPETPDKGASKHRKQDTVDIGISTKHD